MNTNELKEKVTNSIIESMEKAVANNWSMPWTCISQPVNASTKARYNGINILMLSFAQEESGYSSPEWASFKQWKAKGAKVRKGEKGTMIVFYKPLKIKDRETKEEKLIPLLKHSYVFNAGQVDGYEGAAGEPLSKVEAIEHAEAFARQCGIVTKHGGDRAFYRPSEDAVHMPTRDQFKDSEYYYSVLFHEYTHATGHKSRLDRLTGAAFGSPDYAYEELIAELGAAFTMAHLGIHAKPREDHAQYISSWLNSLKNDKNMIFKAASQAQKAIDYLIEQQEQPQIILAA